MPKRELEHIDCLKMVEELATRMNLEEEERRKFIERCMARAGYTPHYTWVPPNDDKSKSGSTGERTSRGKGWFPNA